MEDEVRKRPMLVDFEISGHYPYPHYKEPKFVKYHDVFFRNTYERKEFILVLMCGHEHVGIPSICVAYLTELPYAFIFQVGDKYYKVPFTEIAFARLVRE